MKTFRRARNRTAVSTGKPAIRTYVNCALTPPAYALIPLLLLPPEADNIAAITKVTNAMHRAASKARMKGFNEF